MKILFLLLLSGLAFFVHAQTTKRVLIDSETNIPIPYATVKILHTNKGQFTNRSGVFALSIQLADSVLFSSLGYKDTIILGAAIGEQVLLQPKPIILSTVIVKTKKVVRKFFVGNGVEFLDRNIKCKYLPDNDNDCYPWGPGSSAEFAERMSLPDSSKSYSISKIYIPIKKIDCWQPFFLNIYEATNNSSYPGALIARRRIQPESEMYKKGKIVIDFLTAPIYFKHTKSFFVSLSWDETFGDKTCVSAIILVKSNKGLSYSRSLSLPKYEWFEFRGFRPNQDSVPFHTLFVAEVEVLQN